MAEAREDHGATIGRDVCISNNLPNNWGSEGQKCLKKEVKSVHEALM